MSSLFIHGVKIDFLSCCGCRSIKMTLYTIDKHALNAEQEKLRKTVAEISGMKDNLQSAVQKLEQDFKNTFFDAKGARLEVGVAILREMLPCLLDMNHPVHSTAIQALSWFAESVDQMKTEHSYVFHPYVVQLSSGEIAKLFSILNHYTDKTMHDKQYSTIQKLIRIYHKLIYVDPKKALKYRSCLRNMVLVSFRFPKPIELRFAIQYVDVLQDKLLKKHLIDTCRVYTNSEGVMSPIVKELAQQIVDKADRQFYADVMAHLLIQQEADEKENAKTKSNKPKNIRKKPYVEYSESESEEDTQLIYEEPDCIVCMDCKPDVIFSCGHCICCFDCASKVKYRCLYCTH